MAARVRLSWNVIFMSDLIPFILLNSQPANLLDSPAQTASGQDMNGGWLFCKFLIKTENHLKFVLNFQIYC